MELEQLKCGECGKGYIASSLPKDSVRFKCICDDCREKPACVTVSFGKMTGA